IPPSAGGGGSTSGASTIRGLSTTGSASSSPRTDEAKRGNSSTRAVASVETGGSVCRNGGGEATPWPANDWSKSVATGDRASDCTPPLYALGSNCSCKDG